MAAGNLEHPQSIITGYCPYQRGRRYRNVIVVHVSVTLLDFSSLSDWSLESLLGTHGKLSKELYIAMYCVHGDQLLAILLTVLGILPFLHFFCDCECEHCSSVFAEFILRRKKMVLLSEGILLLLLLSFIMIMIIMIIITIIIICCCCCCLFVLIQILPEMCQGICRVYLSPQPDKNGQRQISTDRQANRQKIQYPPPW